jgi:hypothetical protein
MSILSVLHKIFFWCDFFPCIQNPEMHKIKYGTTLKKSGYEWKIVDTLNPQCVRACFIKGKQEYIILDLTSDSASK